jgi:3-deoxy-D-manno-octulosonate 8-phosphate phosphatase (KDO 8-P phosphatase)
LLTALEKIKCFVFDVDGVLTNGTLIVMPDGLMVRSMNIKDGYAIQLAIKKGYKVWIISGGHSIEVQDRLEKLENAFRAIVHVRKCAFRRYVVHG